MDTREWGNRKVTYPTKKDLEDRAIFGTMPPTFIIAALIAAKLFNGLWFFIGFVLVWVVLYFVAFKCIASPLLDKHLKKNPWIK